ncbi:helix-turn-helix domain-containing protein [Marinoscillum furvescens]|uniref:Helix-turn-helix protein n=1 Tax=Marinoscillum furvescens DSM 4134 TaxID=1122208 RepID=A0A3D9L1E1_MARFU|nr:helix-turn-helix transcriptional regulator [Marinoscillum furvescens]RED97876.1 helix-turn-helix protein [Marinoscillum furvescens DSM 4134]
MHKKETFGEVVRKLREERKLPIRKVAAILDLDPSTLSKIERNDRSANKDLIPIFARIFEVEEKELLIHFLSDKVTYDLIDEDYTKEVLMVAEEKINYQRSKKAQQGKLKL